MTAPNILSEIFANTGTISGVFSKKIEIEKPFIDISEKFSHIPGTTVLLSGGDIDCSRYHIIGTHPLLIFSGKGNQITIETDRGKETFKSNPFFVLRELLKNFEIEVKNLPHPVSAGIFGYLSYDLKDHIEALPRTCVDDMSLPQIYFAVPSIILIKDKKKGETTILIPKRTVKGEEYEKDTFDRFMREIETSSNGKEKSDSAIKNYASNFTKDEYIGAISCIKNYISAGDIYQVNMSQRFSTDYKGEPYSLFKALYKKNPAPFFAYIHAGDHYIVSTSPERFILKDGDDVESRPIKGTRPRGKTPEEDNRNREDLLSSKKDDAELSMIVDLIRNDIGKVCRSRSIVVTAHKRLEAYENVYHLVSIIKGKMEAGKDSIDLIKAAFPGGSITGCPKIRSMEIIDELETVRRHIYTGSIGYISFHDTMDLSIAIRTATIYNDRLIFSVGGGIVYDSVPEDEFEETLHKGKTLIETIAGNKKNSAEETYAWMNGIFKPLENVHIPFSDQGLQYGYGFFETIRCVNGDIRFLKEHIHRFNTTWGALFSSAPLDLSWNEIIKQLLSKNNLSDSIAAVKILATFGNRETPPFQRNLIVSCRPYIHRLESIKKEGITLDIYPHPRQTPLADHKTLNYLYSFLAGKWAKENGADEALILNPDGSISETNTANIFLIQNNTVVIPESNHVLPGIMETEIVKCLGESKWNYNIIKKKLFPEDMFESDEVILSNSLMGAVPVINLKNRKIESSGISKRINDLLL